MSRLQKISEHIVPACRRQQHYDNQILIHTLDHSNCVTQDSVEHAVMPVGWLQRPIVTIKRLICLHCQDPHFKETVCELRKTSCKEIIAEYL